MLTRTTLLALAVTLAGCSRSSNDTAELGPNDPINLEDRLGDPNVVAVGVTVSPTSGTVYVLTTQGLYSVTENGEFSLFADEQTLYQAAPSSTYTDIVALGNGQFALTALNDGFWFDSVNGTVQQHFCYVPGFFIPGTTSQLTQGVAFDPATQRLIAQPVTFQQGSIAITNSEVGTFPITGGEGDDWHPIPDITFLAGAIAVDDQSRLWLGRGSELHRYDLDNDTMTFERSLEEFGVTDIHGLAFHGDRLLVVDQPSRTLVRVPLGLLGL